MSTLVAALVVTLAVESTARAQDAYGCIDRLSDADVNYRLRYVETALDRARRVEMPWWVGWMAFNAANAVIAWVGLARSEKPVVRDTWLVQGIGATMFVVPEAVIPLVGVYSRRRLGRFPEATPEERRVKLREATHLLEKSVLLTASQRGLGAHLAGFIYGTASTLYVAYRHKQDTGTRNKAMIIQFTTTVGVAEITILSVPRRSERSWEAYRSFACSDPAHGEPSDPADLDEGRLPPPPVLTRAPSRPPVQFGIGLGSFSLSGSF